jgi:hypothetical protein
VFKPEQINHDFHWLFVMGRMKPGVSIAQAQADMQVVPAVLLRITRNRTRDGVRAWSCSTTISFPATLNASCGC